METHILSRSSSFDRHVTSVLGGGASVRILRSPEPGDAASERGIVLIHAPSFEGELEALLTKVASRSGAAVGIAADHPEVGEMLALSRHGIASYFNSYMADLHYHQMVQMLTIGQTWFAPDVLSEVIRLARRAVGTPPPDAPLGPLTVREREIATEVGRGLSNKQIANLYGISERTVKAHLTHIFEKLQVRDRLALAARVNGWRG